MDQNDQMQQEIQTFAQLLRARSEKPTLDDVVALTCFCKFKPYCVDKNGPDCVRHRSVSAGAENPGAA